MLLVALASGLLVVSGSRDWRPSLTQALLVAAGLGLAMFASLFGGRSDDRGGGNALGGLLLIVLGPLAADTTEADRLRITLQAYFASGGSKAGASSRLLVHEKTVAYRLRQAAKLLGVSIDDNRLDLEAALSVWAAIGQART